MCVLAPGFSEAVIEFGLSASLDADTVAQWTVCSVTCEKGGR